MGVATSDTHPILFGVLDTFICGPYTVVQHLSLCAQFQGRTESFIRAEFAGCAGSADVRDVLEVGNECSADLQMRFPSGFFCKRSFNL